LLQITLILFIEVIFKYGRLVEGIVDIEYRNKWLLLNGAHRPVVASAVRAEGLPYPAL
jgi:hypothetical protein